mmetsp:Transcript_2107/g.3266  ORF Transcript_2107/g.3266 Transcript_2107/m.3266 type:complete len:105 (+) Transcript_2107:237-551(+)
MKNESLCFFQINQFGSLHNLISKAASCKGSGVFILTPRQIDAFLSVDEKTSAYHGRSRTSTKVSYFQAIAPTHSHVPVQTKQSLKEGTSASIERKALRRSDHEP